MAAAASCVAGAALVPASYANGASIAAQAWGIIRGANPSILVVLMSVLLASIPLELGVGVMSAVRTALGSHHARGLSVSSLVLGLVCCALQMVVLFGSADVMWYVVVAAAIACYVGAILCLRRPRTSPQGD